MSLTSYKKQQFSQCIISQLEENDDGVSIKTGLSHNYNTPHKIKQQSYLQEYCPYILTTSGNGGTNIYEIELESKMSAGKGHIFRFIQNSDKVSLLLVFLNHY